MKNITSIAVIFAILLVSASAVPVFAGSPADTPGAPSSLVGADAGVVENDNLLSEEPLLEQTASDDDSSGVSGDPPDQDTVPDAGDDGTPSTVPEDEGTLTETEAPTNAPTPDGDDMTPTESGETPETPEESDAPGPDGVPLENSTVVKETPETPEESDTPRPDGVPPENSTVVKETPGTPEEVSPEPVETASQGAPENATATQPTETIPPSGVDEVENESVSSAALPEGGMTGESYPRAAVLCVWEQLLPVDGRLDDDPGLPGSQFLPPCAYGAVKTVQVCAVVAGDGATPDRVVADVASPDGSPFSHVNLTRLGTDTDALEGASMAELVTYAHDMGLNEAVRALERGGAAVYMGELDLPFSQAPGDYNVSVQTLRDEDEPVGQSLTGVFTYLPTASFEIDFATVDYGTIKPEEYAWVKGDADPGTAERPTVRNTGNVPIRIVIVQDNMGLDLPVTYMARLGDSDESVAFEAMEEVTLPGVLPVNETRSISLALWVPFGSEGASAGRLQISSVPLIGEQ